MSAATACLGRLILGSQCLAVHAPPSDAPDYQSAYRLGECYARQVTRGHWRWARHHGCR